jgi:hypothetical protein
VGRGQRDVDVTRLLDRLAAVHRLHHGQLASSLLDEAGDPEEISRPPRGGHARPGDECLTGGIHRAVHVDRVGLRHLGELLLRGGIDRRKTFLAVRLDHPAADVQPVPGLDADVVGRLGRGRVLESLLRQLGRLPLGDRHQSIVK